MVVWTDRQEFHCFGAGCGIHGDVIDYVRIRDGGQLTFGEVLRRLNADDPIERAKVKPLPPPPPREGPTQEELRALAVAGEFYRAGAAVRPRGDCVPEGARHHWRARPPVEARIRAPRAAACVAYGRREHRGRAFDRIAGQVERWRKGPDLPAVRRTGDRARVDAQEATTKWLTGRVLPGAPETARVYRNVRKTKPLLGLGRISAQQADVVLVEGPFDWLAAMSAGLPALATLGQPSAEALATLARFRRVYVALDSDNAGDAASQLVIKALGEQAVRVELPGDVSDVGDLGKQGAGRPARVAPGRRQGGVRGRLDGGGRHGTGR